MFNLSGVVRRRRQPCSCYVFFVESLMGKQLFFKEGMNEKDNYSIFFVFKKMLEFFHHEYYA